MKNSKLTFIFLLLFTFNVFAQKETEKVTKAYPIIGWDSLRVIIEKPGNYPELLRRAGFTGMIHVSLLIDSSGSLIKVEPSSGYLSKADSLKYRVLIPSVETMLDSIKWYPSYKNNEPINDIIYRSFNFFLVDDTDKGFNIIAPKFLHK